MIWRRASVGRIERRPSGTSRKYFEDPLREVLPITLHTSANYHSRFARWSFEISQSTRHS